MTDNTESRLQPHELTSLYDALSTLSPEIREKLLGTFATAKGLVDAVTLMADVDSGSWHPCTEHTIRAKVRGEILREVVEGAENGPLNENRIPEIGQEYLEDLHFMASRLSDRLEEE